MTKTQFVYCRYQFWIVPLLYQNTNTMTPEFLKLKPMQRMIFLGIMLPEVIKDQEMNEIPADCRVWCVASLCEATLMEWISVDKFLIPTNQIEIV